MRILMIIKTEKEQNSSKWILDIEKNLLQHITFNQRFYQTIVAQ